MEAQSTLRIFKGAWESRGESARDLKNLVVIVKLSDQAVHWIMGPGTALNFEYNDFCFPVPKALENDRVKLIPFTVSSKFDF